MRNQELFPCLPLDYYVEAMSLTHAPYLVFSDDIGWCRENLPGQCLFVEHNRDFESLFLMTVCDEHITANSTFSWWGAWFANTEQSIRATGMGLRSHIIWIPWRSSPPTPSCSTSTAPWT